MALRTHPFIHSHSIIHIYLFNRFLISTVLSAVRIIVNGICAFLVSKIFYFLGLI